MTDTTTDQAGADAPPPFRAAREAIGFSQANVRALVRNLTGARLSRTTTMRWDAGTRECPPGMLALLELLRRLPEAERRRVLARFGF
jgi:DNA-binding Lrp family transcriptional regulator